MANITWKTWPRLLAHLNKALDLEGMALGFGLLKRRRCIKSAADLLRLALAYGPGGQSLRETALWSELQGLAHMSAPALLYQLRDASDWLEAVALGLLHQLPSPATAMSLVDTPTTGRPIRLIDASTISAPGGKESFRLHATYDLNAERLCAFDLTDKTVAESFTRGSCAAKTLHIADRVYAKPGDLRLLSDMKADFLVRLGSRSLRLLDINGKCIDLAALVDQAKLGQPLDIPVVIDRHSKRVGSIAKRDEEWRPFPARLVILVKPNDAAAQSRKQAKRESQKGMHQMLPATLKLANYLMLLTSLDVQDATPEKLQILYRKRWQIELLFKRLKSLINIDRLPAKEPRLAKAWLCAHLIPVLQRGKPCYSDRYHYPAVAGLSPLRPQLEIPQTFHCGASSK